MGVTAMNKEVKAKWIEALCSGKYKQTEGQLRDNGGFCCLGVLCDISGLDEWKTLGGNKLDIYMGESGELPSAVTEWAGFRDDGDGDDVLDDGYDPYISALDVSLAGLNDEGRDFESIAKIIEEYIEAK